MKPQPTSFSKKPECEFKTGIYGRDVPRKKSNMFKENAISS